MVLAWRVVLSSLLVAAALALVAVSAVNVTGVYWGEEAGSLWWCSEPCLAWPLGMVPIPTDMPPFAVNASAELKEIWFYYINETPRFSILAGNVSMYTLGFIALHVELSMRIPISVHEQNYLYIPNFVTVYVDAGCDGTLEGGGWKSLSTRILDWCIRHDIPYEQCPSAFTEVYYLSASTYPILRNVVITKADIVYNPDIDYPLLKLDVGVLLQPTPSTRRGVCFYIVNIHSPLHSYDMPVVTQGMTGIILKKGLYRYLKIGHTYFDDDPYLIDVGVYRNGTKLVIKVPISSDTGFSVLAALATMLDATHSLDRRFDEVKTAITGQSETLSRLEQLIHTVRVRVDEVYNSVSVLKSSLAELASMTSNVLEEVRSLESHVGALGVQINASTSRLEKLMRLLMNETGRGLAGIYEELSKFNGYLGELNYTLSELILESSSGIKAKLDRLEASLADNTQRVISEVRAATKKLGGLVSREASETRSVVREAYMNTSSEVSELKRIVAEKIDEQRKTTETMIAEVMSKLASIEGSVASLNNEVKGVKTSIAEGNTWLESRLKKLEAQVSMIHDAIEMINVMLLVVITASFAAAILSAFAARR